jgi:hypothetical protein
MIEILIDKTQRPFLSQFLSSSLLGVCCNQSWSLMDESEMFITQMGSTIDQNMAVVAWDALFDPVTISLCSMRCIVCVYRLRILYILLYDQCVCLKVKYLNVC